MNTVFEFFQGEYSDYLQMLNAYVDSKIENPSLPDYVLFCQFDSPVYTCGLNGSKKDILRALKYPMFHVEHGGKLGFHNAGQLVVTLVFDISKILRGRVTLMLVSAIQNALATVGLKASFDQKSFSLWVPRDDDFFKIGFFAFAQKEHILYHGAAVPVNGDLTPFNDIVPCGYNYPVTSLKTENIFCEKIKLAEYIKAEIQRKMGDECVNLRNNSL